jgi:hypothetical protein
MDFKKLFDQVSKINLILDQNMSGLKRSKSAVERSNELVKKTAEVNERYKRIKSETDKNI